MSADHNLIVGVERLIAMRIRGEKPTTIFVLMIDGGRLSAWDVAIHPRASIARVDFRPFIGLDVVLMADTASDRVRAAFRHLCKVANSVVVTFTDRLLQGELGWRFMQGQIAVQPVGEPPVMSEEAA